MRVRTFLLGLGAISLLLGVSALPTAARPAGAWPSEAVTLLETLPVQAEGRIKPLRTWADYTLLRMNHRRSCTTVGGRRLSSVEWFLDVLLRPALARSHPCFLVEDSVVLDAVGLSEIRRKKRDRYSYEDLLPGRARLAELGARFHRIDAKKRSALESGLVAMALNVGQFERLLHALDFARAGIELPRTPAVARMLEDRERDDVHFATVLRFAKNLRAMAKAGTGVPEEEARVIRAFLTRTQALADQARMPAFIPPVGSEGDSEQWSNPADVAQRALQGDAVPSEHVAVVGLLGALARNLDDHEAFTRNAQRLQSRVQGMAEERGEYRHVELEVQLYRLDPFDRSLVLYLLAFVLVALGWLRPNWRWPVRVAVGLLLAGLALHITGITLRCIIRGRPPISTLYETVLFVTAFGVAASLVLERFTRRGIALALAPVLGALGLFIANRYELVTGTDTMPRLAAVLDTNFWLATHVTCITIGYSAALLAGALAHVHVLGRVFGLRRGDRSWYRELARMVYGVVGFALIFSVVGTILGGIWANESWGRFWGWDPKENGALLIVLGALAILHGRLSGLLRDHGVCMAAVALSCVTAFSWWGVNLLGIGLHSYGFASGVWGALKIFYAIEAAVLLIGSIWWIAEQRTLRQARLAKQTTS